MRLPAPTYIEYVLQWISNRINDETLFPTKASGTTTASTATPSAMMPGSSSRSLSGGASGEIWIGKEGGFPQSFEQTCKGIYKQMFRIFAHIYHTHFDKILHMSLEAHFNSLFVHFIHFSRVRAPELSVIARRMLMYVFRLSTFSNSVTWSRCVPSSRISRIKVSSRTAPAREHSSSNSSSKFSITARYQFFLPYFFNASYD
jgi:hypothetical protein